MSLDPKDKFFFIEDNHQITFPLLEEVCKLYHVEYTKTSDYYEYYEYKLDKVNFFTLDFYTFGPDGFFRAERESGLWVLLKSYRIFATNDPEVVQLVKQHSKFGSPEIWAEPMAFYHAYVRLREGDFCMDKDAFIVHHVRKLPIYKELSDMYDTLCKNNGIHQ